VRECYDRAHAPLLAVDWVPSLVVVVLMCCFPHSVLVFGLRSRGSQAQHPVIGHRAMWRSALGHHGAEGKCHA
jgi:hypothetical protein